MQTKTKQEKVIVRFFSGKTSADEMQYLKSWIDASIQNKTYFEELRNIWQVTHPAFQPEDIDVVAAQKVVMAAIQKRKLTHPSFFIWWQRIAAILILPISLTMGYLFYRQSTLSKVIAYQEISAPFGITSKVDLPDGSTVWLNSGSKLTYPLEFSDGKRKVRLIGEAFFKVHADKKNPFVVKTENFEIKATGTEFNVEAYFEDSITAVTLVEGNVNVKIGERKKINLRPNDRLVYNNFSKNYELNVTDAKHWGLWKDGILSFRDEPLDDVFKRLSRTFNVDIKVNDSVVARQLYRATFEGESLDDILELLKMTAPIDYKKIGRVKQTDSLFNKDIIEVFSTK